MAKAEQKRQCKEKIYRGRSYGCYGHYRQCNRSCIEGSDYCATHDPERVAIRDQKLKESFELKWQEELRQSERQSFKMELWEKVLKIGIIEELRALQEEIREALVDVLPDLKARGFP